MKKIAGIVALVIFMAGSAAAQTGVSKNKTVKKSTAKKSTLASKSVQNSPQNNRTVLSVTDAYPAKGTALYPAAGTRLSIADPTVRALNTRAAGGYAPLGSSGIIGVPKRAYGFSNGHILFRRTDAATFGTSTGSGSVGTGSSTGNIGTSGAVLGVNGKSPYAGNDIYSIPITDGRAGTQNTQVLKTKKDKKE